MPILNYTTKITPQKTVNEIQGLLGRCKQVTMVTVEYGGGEVTAVLFAIMVSGSEVHFRLPCNAEGVLKALTRDRVDFRYRNLDHAKCVAWRIVKDWVEGQLALVDANQAQLAEVFLPYAIINGQTVFKMFEAQQAQRLITDGGS
jgi:hypothetical protein